MNKAILGALLVGSFFINKNTFAQEAKAKALTGDKTLDSLIQSNYNIDKVQSLEVTKNFGKDANTKAFWQARATNYKMVCLDKRGQKVEFDILTSDMNNDGQTKIDGQEIQDFKVADENGYYGVSAGNGMYYPVGMDEKELGAVSGGFQKAWGIVVDHHGLKNLKSTASTPANK